MKKILIALPDLTFGGSERSASELANYFSKNGIGTSILLMYKRPIEFDINEEVNIIEPKKNYTGIFKYIYPIILIKYLRKQIKIDNPDSILLLGYKTYAILACIGLKVRLIDSIRTNPNRIRFPNNKFKTFIYNRVRSILNYRIDGVITQTNKVKEELKKRYTCNIVHIPNSIRTIHQYDIVKKNIILSVGRLSEEKGHRYLLTAFAKSGINNWKLKLIGDGPQRSNLENLAKNLGIQENVIFEGFQTNVDLYMQEAKIFVLPSLIEGFPNALIEAMANGLACISFDCDFGPSEIIQHNINGYLVEEKNISELSEALSKLVIDIEYRVSISKEATKVLSNYQIEKIGQDYSNFLLNW